MVFRAYQFHQTNQYSQRERRIAAMFNKATMRMLELTLKLIQTINPPWIQTHTRNLHSLDKAKNLAIPHLEIPRIWLNNKGCQLLVDSQASIELQRIGCHPDRPL